VEIADEGIDHTFDRALDHIICAIPITGYIYSPFAVIPDYAPPTRFVFFPIMLLSGLWMWKGHLVRQMISKAQA
jgi:hypothetical protein